MTAARRWPGQRKFFNSDPIRGMTDCMEMHGCVNVTLGSEVVGGCTPAVLPRSRVVFPHVSIFILCLVAVM